MITSGTRQSRGLLSDLCEEGAELTGQGDGCIGIDLDTSSMTDEAYRKLWNRIGKLEIRCVEKNGQCFHNVGDTYYYDKIPYRRPDKVCYALLHVMELYTWRVALGFPSWDAGDRNVYRVHCPDRTGTVWEMKRVE
jgi:uncharacterized repeat protein (TIGR04076 family)